MGMEKLLITLKMVQYFQRLIIKMDFLMVTG